MKKTLLLLFAILAVPSSVVAQGELNLELVVERDNMYVYEEYGIAQIQIPGNDPIQFRVKLSSEAPADGTISRDNFVALTSARGAIWLLAVVGQAYEGNVTQFLQAFDFTESSAPIGRPDYEINLRMTSQGMKTEFINNVTGEVYRTVETWGDRRELAENASSSMPSSIE